MLSARILAIVIFVAFLPVIVLPVTIIVLSHVGSVEVIPVIVTPPIHVSLGILIVVPTIIISPDGKPGI